MQTITGYTAGANLGHWISQYGTKGKEHWDSYIQESDIQRMKSWGMDHVRVPVDYMIFEHDDNPGVYDEAGLRYIDNALRWCKTHGMNMVLDLHHAPGFFFGKAEKKDLFTNRESQIRFINIWKFFSHRYHDEGDNLIFELLNELVWETSDPWNALWQETVREIFKISPHRRVIVGGNRNNNVDCLKDLVVDPDDRIIYTFHFYDPFLFTHQQAGWIPKLKAYETPVTYPFRPEDHLAYYEGSLPEPFKNRDIIDKDYLEHRIQKAIDFSKATGKFLYCGEYGVIGRAPTDSAVRWLNDISDVLLAHGFGRAVWSYRGFTALTSGDNQSWNADMAKAVAKH